jgi:hypothetical protein
MIAWKHYLSIILLNLQSDEDIWKKNGHLSVWELIWMDGKACMYKIKVHSNLIRAKCIVFASTMNI